MVLNKSKSRRALLVASILTGALILPSQAMASGGDTTYPKSSPYWSLDGNTREWHDHCNYDPFGRCGGYLSLPDVGPFEDQTNRVGHELYHEIFQNHIEGETRSVVGLPHGLHYDDANGNVVGTPQVVGTYTVTVSKTNEDGTSSATFKWHITGAYIEANDMEMMYGEGGRQQVRVHDEDNYIIEFKQIGRAGKGISFRRTGSETGVIRVAKNTPVGEYQMTLRSIDECDYPLTKIVKIVVKEDKAPAFTMPNALNTVEETPGQVVGSVVDPEGKPVGITYNAPNGAPAGLIVDLSNPAAIVVGTSVNTPHGVYPVDITATDPAGNQTTHRVVVTVEPKPVAPVNGAPQFTSPNLITQVLKGFPASGRDYVTDPENDPITVVSREWNTPDGNAPQGITVSDPTGADNAIDITVTEATPFVEGGNNTYAYTLTVTDGTNVVSNVYTFVVNYEKPNTPPTVEIP